MKYKRQNAVIINNNNNRNNKKMNLKMFKK